MNYYDIHTHKRNVDPQVISVQNIRVGKDDPHEIVLNLPQHNYSIGIHPWDIHSQIQAKEIKFINEFIKHPHVLCVGEAGLDKLIDTPLHIQQEVLEQQIQCAETNEKPLILHCVKAWNELITLKKQFNPKQPWIIHGFRGNRILSEQLFEQGFYLSFSSKFNAETIHTAMLNRLFLETDALPITIQTVYKQVSAHLNISESSLQATLTNNFNALFKRT